MKSTAARNYWLNLLKLLRRDHLLRPLAVAYHVTTRCNLNCIYCEDYGARRNAQAETPLPLADALRALRIVRGSTDNLILTGGEPLLYPGIVELATRARRELRFRRVTLLTNALLLPQHEDLLPALDRLVISLDAINPQAWGPIINAPPATAQTIIDYTQSYARRQKQDGYQLVVNCVLTPQTLPHAQGVLDFCIELGLLVSFSPQAVHNWPNYDLLVSEAYKQFLEQLMEQKRRGAPILGSLDYLRTLRDLVPFTCYPTLVPHVLPNGDLAYPCRPIQKENGSHGGRACNLLDVDSWAQATQIALEAYGPPPRICTSCFQQCYAEPSLMQSRPLSLLRELALYAPSRRGSIWTHTPG